MNKPTEQPKMYTAKLDQYDTQTHVKRVFVKGNTYPQSGTTQTGILIRGEDGYEQHFRPDQLSARFEQPKMYRLLNDEEWYYAQFGLTETNMYSSDTIVYGTRKIQDLVDNKQSDWELVQPEPFTHKVITGFNVEDKVRILSYMEGDGPVYVINENGDKYTILESDLELLNQKTTQFTPTQTTLTPQQHENLVTGIYNLLMQSDEMDMDRMGDCREAAETAVREWAETSNIDLP